MKSITVRQEIVGLATARRVYEGHGIPAFEWDVPASADGLSLPCGLPVGSLVFLWISSNRDLDVAIGGKTTSLRAGEPFVWTRESGEPLPFRTAASLRVTNHATEPAKLVLVAVVGDAATQTAAEPPAEATSPDK